MGNTTIIAGHNLGLGDTSARLLNRNDPLGNDSLDKNQSAYINVANGNLVIQEQDVMLTSVAAMLRKSDVQLASGIGGKQELKVRFADDALAGNMRTSAFTLVSWNDTAASTLSRVQSQSNGRPAQRRRNRCGRAKAAPGPEPPENA
jgi:hypothetical protein